MVLIALIAFYLTKSSADVVQSIPILGVLALSAQRLLPLLQQMYFGYSSIKGVGKSLEDILVISREWSSSGSTSTIVTSHTPHTTN